MVDIYNKQVEKIRELEKKHKYDESYIEINKLKCKYLSPIEEDSNLRDIGRIFNYGYKDGPCLEAMAEKFGNRKQEERVEWRNQYKSDLDKLYKRSLTGGYCVARKTGFYSSDLPSGDYHYVFVEIDIQKRCPAFENDLEKKD